MQPIDRRTFLGNLAGSLLLASAPAVSAIKPFTGILKAPPRPVVSPEACWLDVAGPFVTCNAKLGISTQFVLTATCFPGIEGFRDPKNQTAYQILMYDPSGKEIKLDNNGRYDIPALHTTLVDVNELAHGQEFWGGARIRLAPSAGQVQHAGDLFSAGFVRWQTNSNFDNVHAHPAAPQQSIGHFNYSMPLPPLRDYHCLFTLFNPNDIPSVGTIRVVDRMATTVVERPYSLTPHQSLLYSMETLKNFDSPGEGLAITPLQEKKMAEGGVIVVRNTSEAVSFGYTVLKGRQGGTFTVDHPLHFSADVATKPARLTPYGANKSYPVEALLYTPLLFTGLRMGGLEFESHFYLSASQWLEEALWLMPFVTTGEGDIAWASNKDERFPDRIKPAALTDQGLIRLGAFQSVAINARDLPLPPGFSGGFGLGTIPKTSHSLLKVEVHAKEWNRSAITHFRPGGATARAYRTVEGREGLATDYVVTDCQLSGRPGARKRDTILAVMNIEFQEEHVGTPKLQLFGPNGLIAEKSIGEFKPLACRHLLLSDIFPEVQTEVGYPTTVRMQDAHAMMIVSAVHLDYERKDLALEHGSDRHSTFNDFHC